MTPSLSMENIMFPVIFFTISLFFVLFIAAWFLGFLYGAIGYLWTYQESYRLCAVRNSELVGVCMVLFGIWTGVHWYGTEKSLFSISTIIVGLIMLFIAPRFMKIKI